MAHREPDAVGRFYREQVLPRLSAAVVFGDVELRGRGIERRCACPLHGGTDPNFAVNVETLAWICHSVCGQGGDPAKFLQLRHNIGFVEAVGELASRVGLAQDYELLVGTRDDSRANHATSTKATRELAVTAGGLTLATLAQAKGLDPELLDQYGWRTDMRRGRPCVTIPYVRRDGVVHRCQIRVALEGKRFFWDSKEGEGAIAYEPDGGRRARELGYLWVVEGATDTVALLQSGVPALGVPGSGSASTIQAQHLEGVERVYISQEPDQGGRRLVAGVFARLQSLTYTGAVHVVPMPAGAKDPCEMHGQDPAAFVTKIEAAMAAAEPVTVRPAASNVVELARSTSPSSRQLIYASASGLGRSTRPASALADLEPWVDPIDLPGLLPVEPWHDELLPEVLRAWVADIADRTQCPPEYPAVGAIVALASVIGRGVAIRPKRHDDWTVPPNLWGAVIGPPSMMKSPVLREVMRPMASLASEAAEAHAKRAFDRELLAVKRKGLAQAIEKAARGGEPEDHRAAFERLAADEAAASAERRYVVYDTTTEKLGEILRSSPRGVLLFRDELVGWFASLDRQGHECDRAFFLEAWNGDGKFVYDRIGRGTVRIDAPCVSILGGIQPGPLAAYMSDAVGGGKGADGLVQRFQLLVYPHASPHWKNVDRLPDSVARDKANELFRYLADASAADLSAQGSETIPFVRFDDEAQSLFDQWRAGLENRLRSGSEHEALEAHLAKYRSLFPSLALIFQLADRRRGPVALVAAERALAWCAFLESHARRVYSLASGGATEAKALLAKLRAGKLPNPFTARDVYRPQWSGLSEPTLVAKAIDVLEAHGWVRRAVEPTDGRPREAVYMHPSLVHREAAQ